MELNKQLLPDIACATICHDQLNGYEGYYWNLVSLKEQLHGKV